MESQHSSLTRITICQATQPREGKKAFSDMTCKLGSPQATRRTTSKKCDDFVMDIEEDNKWRKPNGLFDLLRNNTMEFCCSTSLHGLRYIGENHRHASERIFWLISFLISTAVVAHFIFKIWIRWNTSPVLVSFADVPTPVWNIPFPAITICPQVKVKNTSFSVSSTLLKDNKTDEEREKLLYSRLVCDIEDFESNGNDTVDNRAIKFIEEVAPEIDEVMFECYWRGILESCSDIFTSVLTDNGLCYTFNILSSTELFNNGTIQREDKHLDHGETSNWSLEGGFPDNKANEAFPRRALDAGAYSGLTIFIYMENENINPLCSFSIHGVKALLHNPTDFPNVVNQYFRVPLDRDVVIGIKPNVMSTSAELRSYPPERRQCFFTTERHLLHFSIYTQENCDSECYTNYTLKNCGCVAYYMPQNYASDDEGLSKCNCMPACAEITYDVENSHAKFSWLDTLNAFDKIRGSNQTTTAKEKIARAAFYYKERQYVTSRRGELYGPADFLASCGGLLGLYLGFSILSLVEIVYFFTVRLCYKFQSSEKKHPAP
ncbi:pickpocket protein 28 isoform X2 [Cryptotermes secundus]|uniref:pickpocket protein 28 isoform X2 n=1 Tax=Cryptotermes secundus TaxID=105785 RepID=UPI000CD7B28F|nr:pickpocket protein 28 isoform X2 [Cryptotermes secundus]